MATLTGQSIASSYEQLLHVDRDGGGNTTTLVDVKDGDNGTTFALKLATDKISVVGDDNVSIIIDSTTATRNGILSFTNSADSKNFEFKHNSFDPGAGTNQLEINSTDTADIMVFNLDGTIGIGTNSPIEKLSVNGQIISTASNSTGSTSGAERAILDLSSNKARIGHFRGTNSAGSGGIQFFVDSSEKMTIDASGNTGIGNAGTDRSVIPAGYAVPKLAIEGTAFSGALTVIENQNDISGGLIAIGKSRGTSVNANTIVQNGDVVGRLTFNPADGTDVRINGGEIRTVVNDSSPAENAIACDLLFMTNDSTSIDAATRFRLDANSRISLSNNDGGTGNTVFGYNAGNLIAAGDNYNVFIGHNVADADMTNATENVGMGYGALSALTEGDSNITIGYSAGETITTSSNNILIGARSGNLITTGASGTVAIGTSALTALTSGTSNVAIGQNSLASLTVGVSNTAIGYYGLSEEVGGGNSTSVGNGALGKSNGGSSATLMDNTGVGVNSGFYNVTGTKNTYLGSHAGFGASGQSNSGNTAIGYEALTAITTGGFNIAIGHEAGESVTTGGSNIHIGSLAGDNVSDASHIIAIGDSAVRTGTTTTAANGTVAVGSYALENLTSGERNTAIGYQTLDACTDSDRNTAVGYQSLSGMTGTAGETHNTAVGHHSGIIVSTGTGNTFLGSECGDALTTGSNNTFIGKGSDGSANNCTNQTVIGANHTTGVEDNSVTLGNADVTKVYMSSDGDAEIYANGTINTSDEKLKQDIKNTDLGLNFINDLRPVSYKLKKDKQVNKIRYGIIAQEVQEVLKKTNNQNFAGITDKGDFLGADYVQFIAPLMKAVQELSAKVTELESKLK